MFKRLGLLAVVLLMAGCAAVSRTNPETWIDVRTAEEYAAGHVPQAINIPYDEMAQRISGLKLPSDQAIYLYCGSGRRAGLAQETLQGLGYSQVTNAGGYDDAQQFLADRDHADVVQ
jgi:phage shock protein E